MTSLDGQVRSNDDPPPIEDRQGLLSQSGIYLAIERPQWGKTEIP